MTRGFLEPLVSLLRVGENTRAFGDPYELLVVVRHLSMTEVQIDGLTERLELRHARAIRQVLEDAGIEDAQWIRYKRGRRLVLGARKGAR